LKKIFTSLVGLFLAITVINTAEANLINNGSFETPEIDGDEADANNIINYGGGNSWTVFQSIDGGWTTIEGQGIEIQENGTTGVSTSFGDQYVELDSHPAPGDTRMGQDVGLTSGAYELSFYYSPRTNDQGGTNGIRYGYDDTMLGSTVFSNGWVQYSSIFSVAEGIHNIWFESFGDPGTFDTDSNTVGGFIDNVELHSVPEPAAMILVGTGLIGVVGLSRRKKK